MFFFKYLLLVKHLQLKACNNKQPFVRSAQKCGHKKAQKNKSVLQQQKLKTHTPSQSIVLKQCHLLIFRLKIILFKTFVELFVKKRSLLTLFLRHIVRRKQSQATLDMC